MKTLGIMSSGNIEKFRAIIEHFKTSKDVKIICISDNLKSDIFNINKTDNLDTKYISPENALQYFTNTNFNLVAINDYKSKLDTNIYSFAKFINLHPSLLPAFRGENALYRAFESGVKVSGVTIHTLTGTPDTEKILAQYPVLISNLTHFDEFQKMTDNLTDMIYPIVIEKTLDNKLFDFQNLIDRSHSCSGSCGNHCSKCRD